MSEPAHRLQALFTSEGWPDVLQYCLHRISLQEQIAISPDWPAEKRLNALARKAELILFIQTLYRQAQEESPFTQQVHALLGGVMPAPAAESPTPALGPSFPTRPVSPVRRQSRGTVA